MAKRGEIVGRWKLIEQIGRGGNADVWRASDEQIEVALKIPRAQKPGREPFRRFKSEVEVMSRAPTTGSMLPLLDANIDPTQGVVFHATPIAKTLSHWTDEDPDFEEILKAASEIARVLATLADLGVHHRDVKPNNIFFHEDAWVVGDLGLATFPGKEALTEAGRKIGPMHYIAPEMLNDPTEAAGEAADVYSLAKTIWVIATGQGYPLPGPHPLDYPPVQVSAFVDHPAADVLDRVLARATQIDPSARPSMSEFADELSLVMGVERGSTPWGDSSSALQREFQAIAAIVDDQRAARERRESEMDEEAAELGEWLDDAFEHLSEVLPYEIKRGHGHGQEKNRRPEQPAVSGRYHNHAVFFLVPLASGGMLDVKVLLHVQPTADGVQEVGVQGSVTDRLGWEPVFSGGGSFPSGSPLREKARLTVEQALSHGIPKLLDQIRARIKRDATN